MKPGGVIVDMAVESGGNVEGSQPDKTVVTGGVSLIGISNLPSIVSQDASQMYSANLYNLLSEYWNEDTKTLEMDLEDDILKSCVISHEGRIVNETIKNLRKT